MVQPGLGSALDTPRTNIGDATYLNGQPDLADISQEASFQSPGKDGDFLQQLRNGRSDGMSLRTPRQRGPLADRRNLPPSIGGAEFTPLLKSMTRNSAWKQGKENSATVVNTPGLDRIDEDDVTALPRMDSSLYLGSRNQSYLENTLPQVDSSSVASTPLAMQPRRGGNKGPLQDGNQLSLREQENVIDRIEKENFGLKLKIHFLEEALRKAGPGFSEAALKENTELKVDKVTMHRELQRYKKHVSTAERNLETYRQQMQELQEKARKKQTDKGQRQELEQLQNELNAKEVSIDNLQRQLDQSRNEDDQLEKLRDNIEDLEADLREKDRIITERDDELEDLKERLDAVEDRARESRQRIAELEETENQNEELDEAKETIQDLETSIRRLEEQIDELKEAANDAVSQKHRAEQDLEELQEEMANKSVVTKGLSRQIEEKLARLQEELDRSGQEYADLEKELAKANEENEQLRSDMEEMRIETEVMQQEQHSHSTKIHELETELLAVADEKDLLQERYESLAAESMTFQQEIQRLEKEVEELQQNVSDEKEYALEIEKDLRQQYQDEIERLNDEISNLQAEVRERDNLYDNDSEKWENEKQALMSERGRAEEKAAGLQRTIDRLRETEGNLSNKEIALQKAMESETERHKNEEAIMSRQIDDLQDALEARQALLTNLRNELSSVRDELRQTQIDYQANVNKVVALQDEVDMLRSKSATNGTPSRVNAAGKDSQILRDQITRLSSDLTTTQGALAEARAERDELQGQLRQQSSQDNDTLQVDQERLDLRTAKLKLDNEVRRLKDECKSLSEGRIAAEKALDDETEKAISQEAKLRQEIVQLRSKKRSSTPATPSKQDLQSAQRRIEELQQKVEFYQSRNSKSQPSGDGDGVDGLSQLRRDLSNYRQKELDFLQKEAAHKDLVKELNMQIAELEGQLHEAKISQLGRSPHAHGRESAGEVAALETKLSETQRALEELRSQSASAELQASKRFEDLLSQLNDLEDQKLVLEEVLEEAREQADETAAHHDKAIRRLAHKLDKTERERDAAIASQTETSKQGKYLRKSQAEIENLESDVRQQQELIDGLAATEAALRRKLERARSERAAFRMSAEKLQRDIQSLQTSNGPAVSYRDYQASSTRRDKSHTSNNQALDTLVRAAEGAEERHKKEVKGMVTQMEWMQARWEREALLRSDVAFAKKFVQLQLDVANACNKAQLRELEHIRKNLLHSNKALSLPVARNGLVPDKTKPSSIRAFLAMARFIARMRLSSRTWASQERVRLKLVAARDEQRRAKMTRQLKVVRAES
ncbi:hypothetical protein C2857_002787 [Epichloe festucae Fl1]|uniref:Uncharacterized protein n=1 Tax=Epichloe festucae (strain Fl1) TaxID=877507 RepID=A0A7S9PRT0_EPIFF|nr:hypothetical protein C2857_002787 [Epichloe festucae Fl1]